MHFKINRPTAIFLIVILLLFIAIPLTSKYWTGKFKPELPSKLTSQSTQVTKPSNVKLLDLTNQLLQTHNTEQLIKIAAKRKQESLNLIKKDPQQFLTTALPGDARDKLPDEVKGFIEKQIEIKGDLSIQHFDNFKEDKSTNFYSLTDDNKKSPRTYNLHFAKNPPGFNTDKTVIAKGIALDSELVLGSGQDLKQQKLLSKASGQAVLAAETTSNKRVLVIMYNFLDNSSEPFTKDDVRRALFGEHNSANAYLQETSSGKVSISGDVYGWYNTSFLSVTNCLLGGPNPYNEPNALSAAIQDGANPLAYNLFIYIFPHLDACHFGGAANLILPQISINGDNTVSTYSHELGHFLGINHAADLRCNSLPIDIYGNCNISEYGDYADAMGNNRTTVPQYNAPHKETLGWIDHNQIVNVTSESDRRYTIAPLESNGQILGLKIPKPDTNENYYIEYRQPIGFDSTLPRGVFNGAIIHVVPNSLSILPWDTSWTKLIYPGINNPALTDGSSFYDKTNGITITQVTHNSGGAVVDVKFGSASCYTSLPTVGIDPNSQSGSPGETIKYSVSITNMDTPACQPRTFTGSLIGKFQYGFPKDIRLSPGETRTYDLTLILPSDAVDGFYNAELNIYNPNNEEESVKLEFTYTITSSDSSAAPTDTYRDQLCSPHDGSVEECDGVEPSRKPCSYFLCTNTCWPRGTTLAIGCSAKAAGAPVCNIDSVPQSKLYDCSNDHKCVNDFQSDPIKCVVPKTNLDGKIFHCDTNKDECRGRGIGWIGTTGCGDGENSANQVSEEVSCQDGQRCWNDFYRSEDTSCGWVAKDPSFHCQEDSLCSGQHNLVSQTPEPTPNPTEESSPTSSQPKTVVGIKINNQEVDLNNLDQALNLHLPGNEGQAGQFSIPVEISYSDGSVRDFVINFNYAPEAPTTEPTAAPSAAQSVCDNQNSIFVSCDTEVCGHEIWQDPTGNRDSCPNPGGDCALASNNSACTTPQSSQSSNDCLNDCGINNGQDCTNQDKADIECANYYNDNSTCSFSDAGERQDDCIP